MRRRRRLLAALIGVAALFTYAGLLAASYRAPAPPTLGALDGRLSPCPGTPNCVSTQAPRGSTVFIEPLHFEGPAAPAMARIQTLVTEQPRATVVVADGRYLHAVFRTLVFRFPDDVEFVVDAANGRIHMRSASRLGQGDLGVNRRRLERLRAAFRGAALESAAP